MRIPLLSAAVIASLAAASPAMAAPPANDAFADALKIGVGEEYSGLLSEATAELGEPGEPQHTVWFRYRSPRNASLTVDVNGTDFYNPVAVYTGNDVASLKLVGDDQDNWDGIVRFKAHRKRTYRIAINGYEGATDYKLWLSDGGIKGKGVRMGVDAGQTVASVRSHGLRLHLSARRRVPMAVALRVDGATARELGLDSRLLGRTHGRIDYGESLAATIRLDKAARKALKDVDSLDATVRLTLPKSTAPDKTLTVPVTL
jgi:hypothetical protein